MDENKGPFYSVQTMSEAPYSDLAQGIVDRKGMHVGSVTIKVMGGQAIAIKFTEEATLTPHAPKIQEEVDPRQLTIYQHNSETEKVADDMDEELKEEVAKGLAGLWRTLNGLHMLPAKEELPEPTEEEIASTLQVMNEWFDNLGNHACPMCAELVRNRGDRIDHSAECDHAWVYPLRFDLGFEPNKNDEMAEHEAFEAWQEKQPTPENEGLAIEVEATA